MAKGIPYIIWLLLSFCFICFVNFKKTGGAEVSSAEERTPWEIFMKDEPRRQHSNEESLRAMHLCMEEEDRKELLITCDRRYSSKFACVGALEGNIQKCDRFEKKQVAVPICVQVESSYISICEYKNLASKFLCSPRNLNTQMSDYKEYRNSGKFSRGLREDIRVCENKERRICLAKEALLPCGDIEEFELKIKEIEKIFVRNTSMLESFENAMAYKSIKSEIDNHLFRDGKENGPNHSSIVPTNGTNNYTLKYKTINPMSPRTGVEKFWNPRESLPLEFDTNKKESNADETAPRFQSDLPVVAHSLVSERSKVKVNSNIKYKTLNVVSPQSDVSEFLNPYENTFTLESSTDSSKFKPVELESLFRLDKPNAPHLISDRGKINPELKHKVNILTPEGGNSKVSTFAENIYNLESAINETEFISGERGFRPFSVTENLPFQKSAVSDKRKSNRNLNYKTVNNLPPKRGISEVPNPRESLAPLQLSEAETGYISKEIKLDEEEKEPPLIKRDFVVDEAVHYLKEHEFVTNGFEIPIQLSTDQSGQKYKGDESTKEESIQSRPRDSASMKAQRESRKPKWRLRMTKQPEKRYVEPVSTLKEPKREPAYAFRAFDQAQSKKKPKSRPTEQSSQTRSFFYVLKCHDCDIKNEFVVNKDALDDLSKVKTWVFKSKV